MSQVATQTPAEERRALFVLLGVIFLMIAGFGLVIPLLPFFARAFNAPAWQVTLLFSAFSFVQFLAAVNSPTVSQSVHGGGEPGSGGIHTRVALSGANSRPSRWVEKSASASAAVRHAEHRYWSRPAASTSIAPCASIESTSRRTT